MDSHKIDGNKGPVNCIANIGARMFWRNAYRTWLVQLAQMSDNEAARKIKSIVEKFNAENPNLTAAYRHGPVKTEERCRHKERLLGHVPKADTFDSRTTASHIFDIIRGTITVTCLNSC